MRASSGRVTPRGWLAQAAFAKGTCHRSQRRPLGSVLQTVRVTERLPDPVPGADRRPDKPEAPLPAECCESGCEVCVWDVYNDQMRAWRDAMSRWRQAHPGEDDDPI
jgi:hypothetical protein